jgi:hypothetical protein
VIGFGELRRHWAKRMGAERLESMRSVLQELVATYKPEP